MTLRLSTGARNLIAAHGSARHAFQGGRLYYYTGTQPASADAAPTGTLLAVFSDSHASPTAEVQATGTLTLDSGSSGSIDTLTVNGISIIGGAVAFDTSLTQTAANLAAEINRNVGPLNVTATSSGAVVTITAPRGAGAAVNTWAVAYTATTISATPANMSGGVSSANGLKFEDAVDGVISKRSTQAWEASAVATGTAGWFRLVGSVADSGAADAAAAQIRLDGNIGTSGANLNLNSTSIASSAVQTLSAFSLNLPTS